MSFLLPLSTCSRRMETRTILMGKSFTHFSCLLYSKSKIDDKKMARIFTSIMDSLFDKVGIQNSRKKASFPLDLIDAAKLPSIQ